MEIYIDLLILTYILNSIFSLYLVKRIKLIRIRWYVFLFISFYSILQCIFLYLNKYLFIFYIIFEVIIFCIIFKRKGISSFLIYIFSNYILYLFSAIFIEGTTFKNFIFIINKKNGIVSLLLYPICFLVNYIIILFVDKIYHLGSYKEQIIIIFDSKKYFANAYFDTGNLLCKGRVPVIFMDKDCYKDSIKDFNIPINIKTILGAETLFARPALIQIIPKKEFYYVYLCLSKNKQKFNGCDVLLNAYLN